MPPRLLIGVIGGASLLAWYLAFRPRPPLDDANLIARILGDSEIRSKVAGQRVQARRVWRQGPAKDSVDGFAVAVFVNYDTGESFRVHADPTSGRVLSTEPAGRPSASRSEIDAGANLAFAHPEVAPLLAKGSVLEGGILIGTPYRLHPPGRPHRFIQFHVLDASRSAIQRVVIVDLSARQVAEVRRGESD